jgi:hypothetical protein
VDEPRPYDSRPGRYGLIFGGAGVAIVLLFAAAVGLIWFMVWLAFYGLPD